MSTNYRPRLRIVLRSMPFARGFLLAIAVIASASAQDYPTKPIKVVVPFTAGSVQDLRARHIGGLLGPRLGQPIVVDNRPGANGAIGSALVAKAKPDGYSLLYGSGSSYAHILGELLARRFGVERLYVPYKGDGQALTDLLGGHIDLMFSTPILLVPQVKAGRVRALSIAGPRRLAALPDVPTMREQGVPNSELLAWAGICAPAGTPLTIVRKLNREALAAMMSAEVKAEVEGQGYEVSANTSEEFSIFIKADMSRIATLVKELGIPPEQ